MTQLLPIKARILEYYIENDRPVTAGEVSEKLAPEYHHEKTTRPDHVEKQVLCYCRVGMLEPVGMTEEGELQYQITDAGKAEEVYLPGHGNKFF